jgi:hypothetical protein
MALLPQHIACNKCAASNHVLSRHTQVLVCVSCGGLNWLNGCNPADIIPAGRPVEDMSVLCVGALLNLDGVEYTLSGSVQFVPEGTYCRLWTLINPEGKPSWLRESYGLFSWFDPLHTLRDHPFKPLQPGKRILINSGERSQQASVDTISQYFAFHMEGENYIGKYIRQSFFSASMSDYGQVLVLANIFSKHENEVHFGRPVRLLPQMISKGRLHG